MDNPETVADTGKPKAKSSFGLSPNTYGLGESVKTGLWGLFGTTAVVTLLVRYGKGKVPGLEALSKVPKNIEGFIKKKVGENAGEWGSALAVGFGVASVVSWLAHVPGYLSGRSKAKQEQKNVDQLVSDNARLEKTTIIQAEENAQLNERLAAIQRPDPLTGRDAQATR